ncbi:MAG: hypothetical protein MJZ74_00130 [Muribaculaceae bacterium]|nr:hypothetical protein [Muribaculaceae bacterium]
MQNTTLHTLQDCFGIINAALPTATKRAVMAASEFELEYAFHTGLEQWVNTNIVQRYGLRGEDIFYATDLWNQLLLVNDQAKFSTFILIEYRRYLLRYCGLDSPSPN